MQATWRMPWHCSIRSKISNTPLDLGRRRVLQFDWGWVLVDLLQGQLGASNWFYIPNKVKELWFSKLCMYSSLFQDWFSRFYSGFELFVLPKKGFELFVPSLPSNHNGLEFWLVFFCSRAGTMFMAFVYVASPPFPIIRDNILLLDMDERRDVMVFLARVEGWPPRMGTKKKRNILLGTVV